MGRQPDKRQVVVYLPEATYRRLKHRAVREGTSMSALVARALEEGGGPATGPVRQLARAKEPDGGEATAALLTHGAPLLGRSGSDVPLEEAIALGLMEARHRPALLRALVVVIARHASRVRWELVRKRLAGEDLSALGAVVDLTAEASGDGDLRRAAEELFAAIGAVSPARPFFTRPALARYSAAMRDRTPAAMRRWGFVCATPVEDFRDALRKFLG